MIGHSELTRRLSLASRALSHAHTAPLTRHELDKIHAARQDIMRVSDAALIDRALTQLTNMSGTMPGGSSTGRAGKGSTSDPVARTAIAGQDPADAAARDLDTRTHRLQIESIRLLRPGATGPDLKPAVKLIATDAAVVRSALLLWARPPDVRWCKHCWSINLHREPVHGSRYRDVCRRCGDWRAVNGTLPPEDILRYLQVAQPVPAALLARHGAVVPRAKGKLKRRKTQSAAHPAGGWTKEIS